MHCCLIILLIGPITFASEKPASVPIFVGNEKLAIDKLRNAVGHKLVPEYMKSDVYLHKWLKAKRFIHADAKMALEKTLEWRKAARIDNLPMEDHGQLATDLFIDFRSQDSDGRPVILLPFSDWDIRRHAVQGKLDHITRRLDLLEETGAQLAYNLTGDQTLMFIADLHGISLRKHVCAACMPVYLTWIIHHEQHYPNNMYKIISINTPAAFDPVLTLVRPYMSESTRNAVKLFGYNRAEYSADIAETIDLDNLPLQSVFVCDHAHKVSIGAHATKGCGEDVSGMISIFPGYPKASLRSALCHALGHPRDEKLGRFLVGPGSVDWGLSIFAPVN